MKKEGGFRTISIRLSGILLLIRRVSIFPNTADRTIVCVELSGAVDVRISMASARI